MLMKRNVSVCVLAALLCIVLCVSQAKAEITVLDANYKVEMVGQYQQNASMGNARYIAADSGGNVYISHGNSGGEPSSLMLKLDLGSIAFKIASSGQNLQGITLGEGTSYGDSVFVAEVYNQKVRKVNYPTSAFNLPANPVAINIDRTGNFGNLLYAGTQYTPSIYSITETGTVSEFVDMGYTTGKTIVDLEIDPTGRYNNCMYISMDKVDNLNYAGILAIDQQGNVSQFLAGGYWGGRFAFDTTENFDFGGDMFVGGVGAINRLTPDGEKIAFLTSTRSIQDFAFGLDGSLYMMEVNGPSDVNQLISIYKVSSVPEPATLVLLGLGAIGLIRRK